MARKPFAEVRPEDYESAEIVVSQAEIDRMFRLVFGAPPPRVEEEDE